MADDFQGLIAALKKLSPKITMELSPKYASMATNYRSKLRADLHERFQEPQLLDLNRLPELPCGFISISHCRTLGGYALSKHPIGFDIEESLRVEWRFVERMWNPLDEKGPYPALHWCAKEAVFKAMGAQQPAVISEIGIQSWKPLETGAYSFAFKGEAGVALTFSSWSLALFGSVLI